MQKALLTLFALSGAAALIYEIVWSRMLQTILSTTVYTSSTIFAFFLLGFSVGAFTFRKVSASAQIKYLFWLQIFIGIYGIASIFLIKGISELYFILPSALVIRLVLSALIIIPPAVGFGAIWPIISTIFVSNNRVAGDIGRLYAINSFGCAIGAFVAGFILIPWFGFITTCVIAAGLNFISAGIVLKYSFHQSSLQKHG